MLDRGAEQRCGAREIVTLTAGSFCDLQANPWRFSDERMDALTLDTLAIRPATRDDVPILADYNLRLAWESEGTCLDRDVVRAGVAALIDNPALGRYFVACDAGEVVGQVLITTEWSDWRHGALWWIQSVYVREDRRRRGVYRALHQYVRRLAQSDPAVVGLRLYVEAQNTRAQTTYESLGLRRTGYLVMEEVWGRSPS